MQFFMATCCFLQVNILFSNKSIYKAAAGRKKLHIVHYGLDHGLQWATLLRWLTCREGGPLEVWLTNIDVPQPGFHGIVAKLEAVHAGDLDIDPDEVLAVSSLFHFRTLTDEGAMATDDGEAGTDPIGAVLGAIREMKSSVFIHAVLNASYSTAFFAARFCEALYNFTALFDMVDTILPRDNGSRLLFTIYCHIYNFLI
ncbi:scarecrow-like protein 33 [Miscanthus floridulus]|uniref:scarecrow-like protein 33 n=1 Tax=Miscanthus floridulus TaxID=154761 RepID=UPI003458E52B